MSRILYKLKRPLIAMMLLLIGQQAWAQESASSAGTTSVYFYVVVGFVFVTALIVLRVAMIILKLLRFMVKDQARKQAEARGEIIEEPVKTNWWSKFLTQANDAVPVEEEEAIILDHNYDGIRELDNHLPPWWKGIFYVSIVFAVVYLAVYHVFGTMPLPSEEYAIEMNEAQEAALLRQANMPKSNIDETNVELVDDPALLSKGRQVFINNCAACHREDGGGGIGPNLTDEYWLHGGGIKNVFATIKHGVPEKGMISWEPLLSPTQMQNVASFVISLAGTNPDNAKDPQGEVYQSGEEVEIIDNAVDSTAVEADSLSADDAQAAL
ncbi:cbb3-type cytochrome c oxidase N-terminal domain-containing protein [Fulvivirga sediminis]|nr:cbb3-type cytochrome c oxidase N-terminal domain-containing protein [Fulvivirga sediminis]